MREWRTRTRLRKTLVDERTTWLARVQATLFHHGVAGVSDKLLSAAGREFLDGLELPDAARERIEVASRFPTRSTASSLRSRPSCASSPAVSRAAGR